MIVCRWCLKALSGSAGASGSGSGDGSRAGILADGANVFDAAPRVADGAPRALPGEVEWKALDGAANALGVGAKGGKGEGVANAFCAKPSGGRYCSVGLNPLPDWLNPLLGLLKPLNCAANPWLLNAFCGAWPNGGEGNC